MCILSVTVFVYVSYTVNTFLNKWCVYLAKYTVQLITCMFPSGTPDSSALIVKGQSRHVPVWCCLCAAALTQVCRARSLRSSSRAPHSLGGVSLAGTAEPACKIPPPSPSWNFPRISGISDSGPAAARLCESHLSTCSRPVTLLALRTDGQEGKQSHLFACTDYYNEWRHPCGTNAAVVILHLAYSVFEL